MKVLITIGEYTSPNPFVRTLASGLRELGVDVVCSDTDFWNNWDIYDIIHVQWPQIFVKKDMKSIEPLRNHLEILKRAGKKIVVTCHNLHPHYSNNPLTTEAYSISYQYADAIVHMGEYSLRLFKKRYPKAYNTIILHHIYDQLYDNTKIPDREYAINRLGLDPNYSYVLCMGAFRHNEEREIAQYACISLKEKKVKILAPGFVKKSVSLKHPVVSFKSYCRYYLTMHKYPNIICKGRMVPDDMMPYYYAASDIALIQRKEILNSGNLPMALMMGKVVVGPNTGNVGTWLKDIDNPTFDILDLTSIKSALECAYQISNQGFGKLNKEYAYNNLNTTKISNQYVELYFDIFNGK